MKCYVGTLNIVKINAVRKILEPYGYEIEGINVDSEVDKQPHNDEETMKGAYNRAQALPKEGLRIGLEAGIEELDGIIYLTNFGVLLVDDAIFRAGGTRIPLPKEITSLILNDHLELSDAMETYFKVHDIKHQHGAIGFFTNDAVIREDIFEHITKLLYGQYLFYLDKK